MNIEHIQEFLELASCLNFTEAAKRLNLTQPALSKHISSLETELGVKLFDRSHRQVHLTDVGCVFLQGAHRIVESYSGAVEDIAAYASSKPLNVLVEANDPDLHRVVSTAVFAMKARGLIPVAVDYGSDDYGAQLREGKADVFIGYVDPAQAIARGFECSVFSSHPLSVCLNSSHPLSRRQSLTWDDLKGQVILEFVAPQASKSWEQIRGFLEERHLADRMKRVQVLSLLDCLGAQLDDNEVFIWRSSQREFGILSEMGGREIIPLEDADNMLVAHAVYRPENHEKLEAFLQQAKMAMAIIDSGC